jgi:hypothetical protein
MYACCVVSVSLSAHSYTPTHTHDDDRLSHSHHLPWTAPRQTLPRHRRRPPSSRQHLRQWCSKPQTQTPTPAWPARIRLPRFPWMSLQILQVVVIVTQTQARAIRRHLLHFRWTSLRTFQIPLAAAATIRPTRRARASQQRTRLRRTTHPPHTHPRNLAMHLTHRCPRHLSLQHQGYPRRRCSPHTLRPHHLLTTMSPRQQLSISPHTHHRLWTRSPWPRQLQFPLLRRRQNRLRQKKAFLLLRVRRVQAASIF